MLYAATASRCVAVCAALGLGAALGSDARAASPNAPCRAAGAAPARCAPPVGFVVPPTSAYDFLVLTGVLPVPGLGPVLRVMRARCATPEAAAESGSCPPPIASGTGSGRHPVRAMG